VRAALTAAVSAKVVAVSAACRRARISEETKGCRMASSLVPRKDPVHLSLRSFRGWDKKNIGQMKFIVLGLMIGIFDFLS
jgi:hypothetical protein